MARASSPPSAKAADDAGASGNGPDSRSGVSRVGGGEGSDGAAVGNGCSLDCERTLNSSRESNRRPPPSDAALAGGWGLDGEGGPPAPAEQRTARSRRRCGSASEAAVVRTVDHHRGLDGWYLRQARARTEVRTCAR